MEITMFGTGYVGLVTGACFAKLGNNVTCVDIDEEKIGKLQDGVTPIFEPQLQEVLKQALSDDNIKFTTDAEAGIHSSEFIYLTLPTPQSDDGEADVSAIFAVAKQIGKHINGQKIIVSKSTVPVGTADKIEEIIARELNDRGENTRFDVVSNPEFLAEGTAVDNFEKPYRIVIGTESDYAWERMRELYRPETLNNAPIIRMGRRSAELAKYACNGMLATRISFMNELARLCDAVGADVKDVQTAMQRDPRIGSQFLHAGVGYGGSCFPKDVKAFVRTGQQNDVHLSIMEKVDDVNHSQKLYFLPIIDNYKFRHVAIWGLAFKKNTDDIRESPALDFVQQLLDRNASVSVHDPKAMDNFREVFGDKITYHEKKYEALDDAAVLVVLTDWDQFKQPDFSEIRGTYNIEAVFDGRNLYIPELVRLTGLAYFGVGRGTPQTS